MATMYLDILDLGRVKLIPHSKARRVIVRYRQNEYQLTYPTFLELKEIEKTLEEMKPRLLKLKEKVATEFYFTTDTFFKTLTFEVKLIPNLLNNIYTNLKDGVLSISYPQSEELESDRIQSFVKSAIENACRAEASRVLPVRVAELAVQHGFTVTDVRINKSRGRWGSCSSKKSINLSYFCMMLPEHLVDFVILHELCHTQEMNHGVRFWALLDAVSGNKAQVLTRELKSIKLKW